jgi:ABC-type multidrug transport system fused ATPase/permease subunit
VIPQFGFLFQSTLRDNLDPEGLRTDGEISHMIDRSGFKIRGVNAIDTESRGQKQDGQDMKIDFKDVGKAAYISNVNIKYGIEKSGKNLSNGEKQIINFLRILLRDAKIICLDEATSNMDPQTDQALHDALFEYVKDKTLLVITHRLENIRKYDRVIVMDKGRIAEEGNYEELRENKDGFFGRIKKEH